MASLKPLIMRANRLLGASLVEKSIVSIDALDAANERLLELMSSNSGVGQISLLSIMLTEQNSLKEDVLLKHVVENEGLGLIDIRNIEIPEELLSVMNIEECWATWTVPFELVEDTRYLATAYYLSPAVRAYWEDKISGKIIWYAASMGSLTEYLDTREAKKAEAAMAAK